MAPRKDEVDEQEGQHRRERQAEAPAPALADHDDRQDRVHRHRAEDRDAVGVGEVARGLEHQHQGEHPDEEHVVHPRQEDLALVRFRGEADLKAREQPELDRLPRERKGAGDHGLARDDSGAGRKQHEGDDAPFRHEPEERVLDRFGMGEEQRALAEIVDDEGGEDEAEPGDADRTASEMPEIGIESLGTGHGEADRAEHGKRHARMIDEET